LRQYTPGFESKGLEKQSFARGRETQIVAFHFHHPETLAGKKITACALTYDTENRKGTLKTIRKDNRMFHPLFPAAAMFGNVFAAVLSESKLVAYEKEDA